MARTITISIPTKGEVKEKTSAFWKKHKKTIVIGGVVAGNAALYAYLNKDSEYEDENIIDHDDVIVIEGPSETSPEDLEVLNDIVHTMGAEDVTVVRTEDLPIEEND